MKSYTDLNQSKKLAEILPLESADMWYHGHYSPWESERKYNSKPCPFHSTLPNWDKPCWSLAALLDVLESEIGGEEGEIYQLNIEKDGPWWDVWYREQYDEANPIETESTEDLVDACYDMIIKLHEDKLL